MGSSKRYKLVRSSTSNPAAGANASIVGPGPYTCTLHTLSFTLVTDVNISIRIPELYHNNGVNVRLIALCPAVATASLTKVYTFTNIPLGYASASPDSGSGYISADVGLASGESISLVVTGIQATDQLSLITHWWRVFY